MHVDVSVDEIPFNRGYYTVDIKYYYLVRGTVSPGNHEVLGVAKFDKRCILYGSEGNAKVFTSDNTQFDPYGLRSRSLPTAVVEAVDPIVLNMKIVHPGNHGECFDEQFALPEHITTAFGEEFYRGIEGPRLYVTLGQFSMVRLERDTQLMLPSFDYCIPDKECAGACEDDPCTLFGKIPFPIDEFFPRDNTNEV